MPAFVIVEITIHDPKLYEDYKKLSTASLEQFGGEFLARGGRTITLEGDWNPERVVVLKFSSVDQAKMWWNSSIYSKARSIRQQAAHTKMTIVEGV